MHKLVISAAIASALLAGCASTPSPELSDCLQPNRRVVAEIVGVAPKPAPKPKPGAEAKPAPKPEAAAADAKPKPKKPEMAPVELNALAQGNSAFDVGSAVLKDGGKQDIDALVAQVKKRNVTVGAIILAGHVDRFEAKNAAATLAEDRAKAVGTYLASKGFDQKLMFWEGKGDKEPVPVTKFCGE